MRSTTEICYVMVKHFHDVACFPSIVFISAKRQIDHIGVIQTKKLSISDRSGSGGNIANQLMQVMVWKATWKGHYGYAGRLDGWTDMFHLLTLAPLVPSTSNKQ